MAPKERVHLPFRWQFLPVESPKDRSIHWAWRAFGQDGSLAMKSKGTFETLTDCMADARRYGYGAD